MPAPFVYGDVLWRQGRPSAARMVRTTEHLGNRPDLSIGTRRRVGLVALALLIGCAVLVVGGCSNGVSNGGANGGSTAATAGANMAGASTDVVVTRAAIESTPAAWILTTPRAAVRSYLGWTSYAYRIATSDVATPTMGPDEAVRIDAYIQLNLEKHQLVDQTLTSISFGKQSTEGTRTLVPTKEKWTYRYVSIAAPGGKTAAGPYTASYDATYTVVKSGKDWVVSSVQAKALGKVK